MASNREERQLMRQRGAGTRKIKEVNFGLSLFGQPAEDSSQSVSRPTIADEQPPAPTLPSLFPPLASETAATEPLQPQPEPSLEPTNISSAESSTQRTPGSARNKLPPRPSTFDIPADEELDISRSNKRRRIESPKEASPLIDAQPGTQPAISTQSAVEEPLAPSLNEGIAIPIRTAATSQTRPRPESPTDEAPPLPADEANEIPREDLNDAPEVAELDSTTITVPEPPQTNGTASPSSDTSTGRGRRKRGRPSPSRSVASNAEPAEPTDSTVYQPTEAPQPPPQLEEPTESPRGQESPTQSEIQQAQEKRLRSRTPASVQTPEESPPAEAPPAEAPPAEAPPVEAAPIRDASSGPAASDTATGKSGRGRGRKRKNVEDTGEAVTSPGSNEYATSQPEGGVEPDEVSTAREPTGSPRDQLNGVDKGKKRAGRPKKLPSPSLVPVEEPEPESRQPNTVIEQDQPDSQAAESAPRKRSQRRNREPTPRQEEQPAAVPEVETAPAPISRRQRRGGEPTPMEEETAPEVEPEAPRAGRKKKQRGQRGVTPREELPEPEPEVETEVARPDRKRKQREQEQPEPEAEVAVQAPRAGRKRRQREQEPEATQTEQPQPEPEIEQPRPGKKRKQRHAQEPTSEQQQQESELEPESSAQPKGTTRRRGERPTMQPEEQPAQEEPTEEQPATKRKPRQPRGETVPVTVHRLANPFSLHGVLVDEFASENEADTPADDTNKQTAKQLSRGGVNPADVLAQICRETLEKTLNSLKNGISNEANTAKRAEWTLRKKAVEAFGSELEGRLLDLSEMLDSNFMLGAKVKKAKRNMMDLRSRLDQVRREREAVALRMDAVRREHTKAEQAGLNRSTINHTLHNLDLALERGSRPTTEEKPLTAGLEFRLRHMAQNVSSTVAGARGGLLNQIKSFNAQLEAVAKRLEG
ncbi:hypothetical protein BJY04DRAFT_214033 [Aspergillus karnatakaensis]|uniref:uncharacterized protein n=1 Tax=Aspergillus karnatakaensis TaxID=1810916 RepID=UPI003CCE0367